MEKNKKMMKKFVSFICCLLPMGAGAVVVNPEAGQNAVSTEQAAWTDAISVGSSITINAPQTNGIVSSNGFSIANNMYVGMASDQGSITGDLYVLDTVQNPFTVVSTGDVSIGAILQVLNGKSLGFKTSDTNPTAFNLTVGSGNANEGIKIGSESATAILSLTGVDALTVNGSVIAYGDFTANANSVTTGLINANAGNMNINSVGAIETGGLVSVTAGSTTLVSGADITMNGVLQNNVGTMAVTATGDVNVSGVVENKSSGDMTLRASDLVVGETMTNESNAAQMTLNLKNWKINGGAVDSYSFVNGGDLYAAVAGDTYMEYGMNLGTMQQGNVFDLDTGTLTFGADATTQTWFSAFSNYLEKFNLAVRKGDLNLQMVLNGANSNGTVNTDANMSLLAQNITAESVRNDGDTLVLKAADLSSGYDIAGASNNPAIGNINIAGMVYGGAGTVTDIIAAGTLTVVGNASNNNGAMTLNGNNVNLASVANSGTSANMVVSSLTEASGKVSISGTVDNQAGGNLTIWAKDVSVGGTISNTDGVMSIRGSDASGGAVQLGALDVAGGSVALNALAGSVAVNDALTVSGGALNLGDSLRNLDVGTTVQISGNLTASGTQATNNGDVNISAVGNPGFVLTANNAVIVDGDLSIADTGVVRNVKIDSVLIDVNGAVSVANKGSLTLGMKATSGVVVGNDVTVDDGGTLISYSNDFVASELDIDGLFQMHGANITSKVGDIDIAGNVFFDPANDPVAPGNGLVVRDTNSLTLETQGNGADINVYAVSVGAGNTLAMQSGDAVSVNGTIVNNGVLDVDAKNAVNVSDLVTNSGTMDVRAAEVSMNGIVNNSDMTVAASVGDITIGDVTQNAGVLDLSALANVTADEISQTAGSMIIAATDLSAQSLTISGGAGTTADLYVDNADFVGSVDVSGDLNQGGTDGMLNLQADSLSADSLIVGGDFVATAGNTKYQIQKNVSVNGAFDVDSGAQSTVSAGTSILAAGVKNAGTLNLIANTGADLGDVVNTSGVLSIDSGGLFQYQTLAINGGNLLLDGAGVSSGSGFATDGVLYQQYSGALLDKDVNILANDYDMTVSGLQVAGINQQGKLLVNTSDVDVAGDIVANDLRFVLQNVLIGSDSVPDWMNVDVTGNVSGGVDFIGLEKMTIGGDYVFDSNSQISAAILPYAISGSSMNETDINYWSSISLLDDNTLGDITNPADGKALISVGGTFTSGTEYNSDSLSNNGQSVLADGQIGITLFDAVDQGTAIWFLHADEGVENFSQLEQLRNLDVKFCNADGSLCYNYLDSLNANNATGDELPVFVSVRDSDADGISDSLYIVFDPRFGGPQLIENLKIQPIVAREPDHTNGEYVSAGALDDLLAGQAINKKFFNGTPIEVIPLMFQGTNMEQMADELYDRMEYYVETSEGEGLARFSRLFQVRELEQIMGTLSLNEHTAARTFEDRMYDEFIWNRNRQLRKAWADVDYGMFFQNIDDGKHTDGNRFAISGGFDWQESDTLVLGLTGRVSYTSSFAHDDMNLGYLPGEFIAGDVRIDVDDTDVGLGGYLMKILNEKMRLYGNAFLDMHFMDVDRTQNFVDLIDGDGFAFGLISEWGLMHDILNQYVVGNLYARTGYNFGFRVKEKVDGDDYMRLKSDGYFILTPGYSMTAQKRIYPSSWIQVRPYASIGVEYDLFGTPDYAKYKFAPADKYTRYNVEIDPLWANIGGGVEVLTAHGIQFGLDYRYQYNNDIQLHNIRVSGSYRF